MRKDHMNKIQLVDLNAQYNSIKTEIDNAIAEVIHTSGFIGGKQVSNFEKGFAEFCNAKKCVGVSSGTSALKLSLIALGIQPGDEVITVPNTFIATTEMVTAIGGKIKFVDIDPKTHLMDTKLLKEAIGPKTKAIIPVHLYGQMVNMSAVIDIAKKNNLKVVEDSCQAHGAQWEGKITPVSDIAVFSFYPAKILGAYGDAGGIVTHSEELAERTMRLRDHGRIPGDKYIHKYEADSARLDGIQAAILSAKLKHLNKWIDRRREIAKMYDEMLDGYVEVPYEEPSAKHVYYMYVVKHNKRDDLIKHLEKKGVSSGIHYPLPLHMQPAYSHMGFKEGDFPEAEASCRDILSLPMYPEMTQEQIEYVVKTIKEFA
jgi:dTDP-4-amino-4,6-dideoxygalactose transaminase